MAWLYYNRPEKWNVAAGQRKRTGYSGIERIDLLVKLGQREGLVIVGHRWLQLDRDGK